MIDVAALAVEQMRAARALQAALDEYRAAREEWLTGGPLPALTVRLEAAHDALRPARAASKTADRAYEAACDAVELAPTGDGQQGLFG